MIQIIKNLQQLNLKFQKNNQKIKKIINKKKNQFLKHHLKVYLLIMKQKIKNLQQKNLKVLINNKKINTIIDKKKNQVLKNHLKVYLVILKKF